MTDTYKEEEELSERQQELIDNLIDLTDRFGKFGQGMDSEGSHYTPAESNPFKSEGLICANCAFFSEYSKSCSIVTGSIEPEAICKFWVIENEELGMPEDEEEPEEEVAVAARYSGIDFSPPAGVKAAAKRGLALHEKGLSGDGLESATVLWARKYTQGKPVSPERARMGNRFYGRNARFANAPKDSPAWVSWLLWGGSAGRGWFAKLVRQMDAADKKSSASVNGAICLAEEAISNPFLKEIFLILTDFEPNANGEGIPRSEAENIIKTSRLAPIKIAADAKSYGGHAGAHPIGAIIESFMDTHNGKDVIKSRAFIWKDEYPAIYDLVKSQASEGNFIGTSWEVYYTHAEEEQGVRWLQGVTFAGTCIVDTPAYGDRTPLLSVAEKESMDLKQLEDKVAELTTLVTQKEGLINELESKINVYQEAERQAQAERRKAQVTQQLSAVFSEAEVSEKLEFYLTLEDTVIQKVLADLTKTVKTATAEKKESIPVPEPTGSSPNLTDPKVLAAALKQALKESK
jgi:hypothetical protein